MSQIMAASDGGLDEAIEAAAEQIELGLPVGLPTDTVYVLAGDPGDPGLTDRLFQLKRRPRSQDLSVLVASMDQARELTTALPDSAVRLMERLWPGALTLVLPQNPDEPLDLGDDDITIGVRMPDHPIALALCAEVGPLAVTPAGHQGEKVFETAAEVAEAFGAWVPLVIDGGVCKGQAATVVDATGEEPSVLREGPVTLAQIEEALR